MQATKLIFVHISAIVGTKFLNITIQENTKSVKVIINKMQIVFAKMLISMHTNAIMGIKSINLTIQANTT